jgi:hypothetical protein
VTLSYVNYKEEEFIISYCWVADSLIADAKELSELDSVAAQEVITGKVGAEPAVKLCIVHFALFLEVGTRVIH